LTYGFAVPATSGRSREMRLATRFIRVHPGHEHRRYVSVGEDRWPQPKHINNFLDRRNILRNSPSRTQNGQRTISCDIVLRTPCCATRASGWGHSERLANCAWQGRHDTATGRSARYLACERVTLRELRHQRNGPFVSEDGPIVTKKELREIRATQRAVSANEYVSIGEGVPPTHGCILSCQNRQAIR
jgi:hypothetical protein